MTQTETEPETVDGEVVAEVEQSTALAVVEPAVVARGEIGVPDLLAQHAKIHEAMSQAMTEGTHYGVIPGTKNPSLLKPGAQTLCVLFRLAPSFRTERTFHEDGHLTVVSSCTLTHIPTGMVVAGGDGLCSTRESRYAYRKTKRACPVCSEEQIQKSKFAPKAGDYEGATTADPPGWYCWKKEGGCGANFRHDDERIVGQIEGRGDNPDLADVWNTVLKMANKRALVDAVINGTAASDVFTQDMEDAGAGGSAAGGTSSTSDAGAGGGTAGTSSDQAATAERVEGPQWSPPADWKTAFDRMAEVYGGGEAGRETAREWIAQALSEGAGVLALSDLTDDGQAAFWKKLLRALRQLETEAGDGTGDSAFRSDLREITAKAFLDHFETALFGPRWRMSPDEESLPTYAQYDADEKEALAVTGQADTDDDIPFGPEDAATA